MSRATIHTVTLLYFSHTPYNLQSASKVFTPTHITGKCVCVGAVLLFRRRRPMFATSRLKLRKFTSADAPRVAEICGDYRVASMCRVVPHPYDMEAARYFIGTVCTQMDGLVLAIETLSDRKLIGCVSIEDFRPDAGGGSGTIATLGYWIAYEAWGNGYATEASSAMVDYAFQGRGFGAIESGYWIENTASARVQSKLGLQVVCETTSVCLARGCELGEAREHASIVPIGRPRRMRTSLRL